MCDYSVEYNQSTIRSSTAIPYLVHMKRSEKVRDSRDSIQHVVKRSIFLKSALNKSKNTQGSKVGRLRICQLWKFEWNRRESCHDIRLKHVKVSSSQVKREIHEERQILSIELQLCRKIVKEEAQIKPRLGFQQRQILYFELQLCQKKTKHAFSQTRYRV